MTIVKVQTPIFSSDPAVPALVYDEARQHMIHQQLDRKALAAMGSDFKAFFDAEWDGRQWKLGERVAFQSW
jgi:hypothetical protein